MSTPTTDDVDRARAIARTTLGDPDLTGRERALARDVLMLADALDRLAEEHRRVRLGRIVCMRRGLSKGDYELLHELARGGSRREVAERLGVSVNTVGTRLRLLYGRLHVHSVESALRAAGLR